MNVTLRSITAENWKACIALTTSPEQEAFAASNLYSLAEAKVHPHWNPNGIYAGEEMVGFLMYGRALADGRYWVIRLMIDAGHQGMEYGRAAMEAVIARLVAEPDCDTIYLDYDPTNTVAQRLYASLGFKEVEVAEEMIVAALDVTARRAAKDADTPVVTFVEAVDDDDSTSVRRQLQAFNDARSEPHRRAHEPEHAPQPLQIFLKDANGVVYGGITGLTYWDWLEIQYLWVDERLRGQDYGTALMQRAEAEAARRGCAHVIVETFSFQARGFYEKRGYRVVGTLEGYPPGGADYRLRKDLV